MRVRKLTATLCVVGFACLAFSVHSGITRRQSLAADPSQDDEVTRIGKLTRQISGASIKQPAEKPEVLPVNQKGAPVHDIVNRASLPSSSDSNDADHALIAEHPELRFVMPMVEAKAPVFGSDTAKPMGGGAPQRIIVARDSDHPALDFVLPVPLPMISVGDERRIDAMQVHDVRVVIPKTSKTGAPSSSPTDAPSAVPSMRTSAPSREPSMRTSAPSREPSITTSAPSREPHKKTDPPTEHPSRLPTDPPSEAPSQPTRHPSDLPSAPTTHPSNAPSAKPTEVPHLETADSQSSPVHTKASRSAVRPFQMFG